MCGKQGISYRNDREADLAEFAITHYGPFNLSSLNEFATGALSRRQLHSQNFADNPVLHLHLYNFGAYFRINGLCLPTRSHGWAAVGPDRKSVLPRPLF